MCGSVTPASEERRKREDEHTRDRGESKGITDEDHGVGDIWKIIQHECVEDGTALAQEVHSFCSQLGTAREVKVHETSAALACHDGVQSFGGEVGAAGEAEVVQTGTPPGGGGGRVTLLDQQPNQQ